MANWETFKLSELRLDQENYRTGPQAGQREAIRALIEDQGRKLANLAEDILDMGGVSPGEPIWVTRDENSPGMYVVLEGNRRVATLKLLENPSLSDGTVIEESIRALAKRYEENPIRNLEARIFASRDEALPWQRRRHLTSASGVGLQGWKPMAKARANRDQGQAAPRFLTVVDFLQDDSDEWSDIVDVLDSKWTTVDRVLNAASLPTVLGVHINPKKGMVTFENGDIAAGRVLLLHILREVASTDFKFASIEKDTDREDFAKKFAALSVKSKATAAPAGSAAPAGTAPAAAPLTVPTAPSARPGPVAPSPRGSRVASSSRPTLAPKTGARTLQVDGVRLNPLYRECREISVKGNENAAAFLLRVFIELSSEALLMRRTFRFQRLPRRLERRPGRILASP